MSANISIFNNGISEFGKTKLLSPSLKHPSFKNDLTTLVKNATSFTKISSNSLALKPHFDGQYS